MSDDAQREEQNPDGPVVPGSAGDPQADAWPAPTPEPAWRTSPPPPPEPPKSPQEPAAPPPTQPPHSVWDSPPQPAGTAGGAQDAPPRPAAAPSAISGGIVVAGGNAADWGELGDCFFTIWTEPRATIRRIVSRDPKYWVVGLAVLSGSSAMVSPLQDTSDTPISLLATLVIAATIGPLVALATLWIGAWMVRRLGHAFLDGTASPEEMRAALAWANLPQVAMLPVGLLCAALFGPGVHVRDVDSIPPLVIPFVLLALVATVWGTWIAANTTAEVQGYRSAWKGFWNLCLPLAILFGIVIAFGIVLALLIRL